MFQWADDNRHYWQHHHRKTLQKILTEKWQILQGGYDRQALHEWLKVLTYLEIDCKAQRDLFLLIHSGTVGRTYANKILWKLLSVHALQEDYKDLSNLVTHEVYEARSEFDRPPREHYNMDWWWWTYYEGLP